MANLNLIPISLTAPTRDRLSRLCWATNVANGTKYNYSHFTQLNDNTFMVSFFGDITNIRDGQEYLNEIDSMKKKIGESK